VTGVFLDTVGLIAAWNRQDQWHPAAVRVLGELIRTRAPLFTTSPVLLECGNAASRHPFSADVVEFRSEITGSESLIIPTAEDEVAAWAAYQRGEAGSAGIVDHVSFVVMRRLGLTDAFTSDAHFRAAGFRTLF
jgi:predicted nucleic acid-binding protein